MTTTPQWPWTTSGEQDLDLDPQELRRLKACWNVCQGMDTELLEHIVLLGETMKTRFQARDLVEEVIIADRLRFMQERDRLQAALQETWRVIDQAGLRNLSIGVPLGPTVWYVKANDAREMAMKALGAESPPQEPRITSTSACGKPGTTCNWVDTQPYGSKCTTCGDTLPF